MFIITENHFKAFSVVNITGNDLQAMFIEAVTNFKNLEVS